MSDIEVVYEQISEQSGCYYDQNFQSNTAIKQKDYLIFKSPGMRLMLMMGYKNGMGLGRHLQGRLRPIETTGQETREGFGLRVKNYEMASDPDKYTNVEWLDNSCYDTPPGLALIYKWEKQRFINDDNEELVGTVFCEDKAIVVESMTLTRELKIKRRWRMPDDDDALYTADIKMGNIDIVFDHMFTCPEVAKRDEILYFADMNAGSHRLCDYILTKMEGKTRGYSFVTKRHDAMTAEEIGKRSRRVFSMYHGTDSTGNIYELRGQLAFRNAIMAETSSGVHIVMCAGENPAKGHDYADEMSTKQLYISQLYLALKVMRAGGNFVMRVGNLYSIFSASLIYLVYRCFERVSIFKPTTSDPTDSEKFIIGNAKLADTKLIENYLEHTNDRINERKSDRDVLGLVAFEDLIEDVKFREYLKKFNEKSGKRHIMEMKQELVIPRFKSDCFSRNNDDNDCDDDVVQVLYTGYVCKKRDNSDDDKDDVQVVEEFVSIN